MIKKKVFTSEVLNDDYQLEYTHNLNTTEIIAKWYDNNGIERSTFDLFQIIDEYKVVLSCNEEIEGTHKLILYYEVSGAVTSGRRLFELDDTEEPDTSLRLAIGGANTQSVNVKLSSFLTWLLTKLGFLKISNNLSDVKSASIARSNLNTYSTTQVNNLLSNKATLYQTGSGKVLGVKNTSKYKPSANYHPAVLRNVNNLGFQLILSGKVSSTGGYSPIFRNTEIIKTATSSRVSKGIYKIVHNKGDSNYFVFGTTLTLTSVGFNGVDKNGSYFQVFTSNDGTSDDVNFEFFMFIINAFTPY